MGSELDELREWYTQHLRARLDALLAAQEAFRAGDATSADSIRRIAHTVKGSGATYGFPEVTAAAATVDHAPNDILLDRAAVLVEVLQGVSGARRSKDHPTVLVVDDDESITRLFQKMLLPEGYRILAAETGAAAEKHLESEPISLVILDLFLPDMDGRNLLVKIRNRIRTSRIPVLVITSHNTLATQKECLALGADDFIEKPLDISKIATLVQKRLAGARDADREARRDLLTGLPNRAALHEAFHHMAAQARRLYLPLSIAILDLDRFKNINDMFGHPAGDIVLQNFSRIARDSFRTADVLGRWGGEEFVALMPETNLVGAKLGLEKVLHAFQAETINVLGTTLPVMSFSGGVILASPHDTLDSAVGGADRFLYQAKETGRARICTALDAENTEARSVLLVEHDTMVIAGLTELLTREGLRLVIANTAAQAVEALERESFAAALIEIRLPGNDGFRTLEHLRTVDRRGAGDAAGSDGQAQRLTPVLMIANLGGEYDVYRALEMGANDYIIKPFSAPDLLARLRRLILLRT